jgi:hypothetical protein
MNVDSIRNELAARLGMIGLEPYSELPGQPEFPCCIVSMPVVTNFHREMAHGVVGMNVDIRVLVGRGETNDAQVELGKYLSTDTPQSVLKALEAKGDTPWIRLKVQSSSDMTNEGDAYGITFTTEIDA